MAETFTITCYGKTKTYPESKRKAMAQEFMTAMAACEGSEQERYTNIYLDLARGAKVCTDEAPILSLEEMMAAMKG